MAKILFLTDFETVIGVLGNIYPNLSGFNSPLLAAGSFHITQKVTHLLENPEEKTVLQREHLKNTVRDAGL